MHSPMTDFREYISLEGIQHLEQMDEDCLPHPKLKFMQQIDYKKKKKVKTQMTNVELVGLLCAQLRSVGNLTAKPYAPISPTLSLGLFAGQSCYYQVSCAIIRLFVLLLGLSGALSLPSIILLLCTLFPTLAFAYTIPYLASVITLSLSPVIPPFSFSSLYSPVVG